MTSPMHPDTMIGLMHQRQRERLEAAAERRRARHARNRKTS
jgi:hypothetical protein